MSTAPIGPETGAHSQSVTVSAPAWLRRVDVVDADLTIMLSGTARDFLVQAEGQRLEPAMAAELETLIRTHDFTRRPTATGLVGHEFAIRVMRTTGPAGSFYTVFSERTVLRRRLAQLTHRFALEASEAELLRLIAGGYPFAEIVRRVDMAPAALRSGMRELEEKLGCIGRKEVAELALGKRDASVSLPSLASFPAASSNTYRARRAGNRRP